MSERSVRVAICGTGYWGINHVRAFAKIPGCVITAICDTDERARNRAAALAPGARLERDFENLLLANDVDAVVLATPARDHAAQVLAAGAAGKKIFVEKPMALSLKDARAIVEAQKRDGFMVMVGHLMIYHPAFWKLQELVRSGELGKVLYLYALRVNLGRLRRDENALWSFAPHDLSMILSLVPSPVVSVAARGEAYLQPGIEDVVFVNLMFADRTMAQIQLSWLDPRKERRLTVVGDKKMVEFDDAHPSEKLRIYDKGYDRPPEFTQYGEYLTVRQGDIHIPRVDAAEPLDLECREFIDCIRELEKPRTDAESALRVVEVLEAASRSLAAGGQPQTIGS